MKWVRGARDRIKRAEIWLYFLTGTLGLYLAAGNLLRGAEVPDEATWDPWSVWFTALVVAAVAVYVPVYALYKAIDAHFEREDKQTADAGRVKRKLDNDLQLICQAAVSIISDACPKARINDLAAHVWLCRDDESFERRSFFTLPQDRKSSGIVWRKGKGVAGMAWESNESVRTDLRDLHAKLDDLGVDRFDQLPPRVRQGLTASEVTSTRRYTGVCAIQLFSTAEDRRLLGVFIIDYTGRDEFDCVAEESKKQPISTLLGGCERILSPDAASL